MLPKEIIDCNRWVGWKLLEGKKKPFDVKTGRWASVTNPATWASYQQAFKVMNRYNGLGVVLDGSDGLIGLDFDKTPLDQLQPVIDLFDSYTEYSPSGKGVRIFLKADVTLDRGNRKDKVEVYQTERFLTVTGKVILQRGLTDKTRQFEQWYQSVFDVKEVKQQQEVTKQFIDVEDEVLLERIFQHDLYGSEHQQRFNGQVPVVDKGDRSLTDYRLAQAFARWTKDQSKVRKLMLQSKLVRPKWFESRGAIDWLELLISKALQSV